MNGSAGRAVTAIAGARRAVQLYPPAHPAYGEALGELVSAITAAAADEPFVLNLHQGRLYHGSLPIPDDAPGLSAVAEAFEALGIESLVFELPFSEHDAVGLTAVLSLRPNPDLDLAEELASRNVTSVVISLLARAGQFTGAGSKRKRAGRDSVREQDRQLIKRSIAAIRLMLEQVAAGDLTAVSGARTLADNLIPRVEQDAEAVLAMAAARRPSERQLYHSLNVMCFSLVIGHKLGLPAEGLSSLGTSALLHDIGKSAFDADDPAHAQAMVTEHPRVGAEMLQHLALDDVAPMLVAYEHHMYTDGSGFPDRAPGYVAHPYSRIVSIADRFVNLTNPDERTAALTPDRALVQILREANQHFDPFFTRLFAGLLGPFPVGSVVRLSDQSVGVVASAGEDPLAPIVRLAFDPQGLELDEQIDVDLSREERDIVEVISAESLDVDVTELL